MAFVAVAGACAALVALVALSEDAPTELMGLQGLRGSVARPLGVMRVHGKPQLLVDLEPRVPSWHPSDNNEYAQFEGEKPFFFTSQKPSWNPSDNNEYAQFEGEKPFFFTSQKPSWHPSDALEYDQVISLQTTLPAPAGGRVPADGVALCAVQVSMRNVF